MRLPSSFTLSPGPTESPSLAICPLMVMCPCAMRISMLRREPWPDCAITFCRRSLLLGLLPPWRSPPGPLRPLPKRRFAFCCGRAHSGTTPPGHSSLGLGWGLSRMGLLRGRWGFWLVGRFLLERREGRWEWDEVGGRLEGGLQLLERGKLVDRAHVQVVEEFLRGGEDRRASGGLARADHLDPAALHERVQGGRRDGHAADLLDVAARDRLAVRDDGEGLQHRARVARRLLARDAVEELLVVGLHAEAPARGDAGELDGALGPVVLQLVQYLADVVGVDLAREQALQLLHGERVAGRQERGFQHALDFAQVDRGVGPRFMRLGSDPGLRFVVGRLLGVRLFVHVTRLMRSSTWRARP